MTAEHKLVDDLALVKAIIDRIQLTSKEDIVEARKIVEDDLAQLGESVRDIQLKLLAQRRNK